MEPDPLDEVIGAFGHTCESLVTLLGRWTKRAEVVFTDAAIDNLRRIGPDVAPKILKKILLLVENLEAGYPAGGERVRLPQAGRRVEHLEHRLLGVTRRQKTVEVCQIWNVGERANGEIYAEAVTGP